MATKTCVRCQIAQPPNNFYKRSIAVDGLTQACKGCLADRRRARSAMTTEDRDREQEALINRQTKVCTSCGAEKGRADFRAKARTGSRDGLAPKCLACESEWHQQHYLSNRDRISQESRERYAADPEKRRQSNRAWYEANKDRAYAKGRAWIEANRELNRNWHRARRARLLQVTVGPVDTDSLWTGDCGICGDALDRNLERPDPMSKSLDHIIPLAKGGTHEQTNLQWAHLVCNQRKGASMPALAAKGA